RNSMTTFSLASKLSQRPRSNALGEVSPFRLVPVAADWRVLPAARTVAGGAWATSGLVEKNAQTTTPAMQAPNRAAAATPARSNARAGFLPGHAEAVREGRSATGRPAVS